jgi:hypothetical protein
LRGYQIPIFSDAKVRQEYIIAKHLHHLY